MVELLMHNRNRLRTRSEPRRRGVAVWRGGGAEVKKVANTDPAPTDDKRLLSVSRETQNPGTDLS